MLKQYVMSQEELDELKYDLERIRKVAWDIIEGRIDAKEGAKEIKMYAVGAESNLHV